MAGGGAKKRAEENQRTLKLIGIYILVCSAVFAAVRLWLKSATLGWGHYAGFAGTLAVHGICYLSIAAVARPLMKGGVVIDGGADLSKGAIQYYFDVLYVTGFVQLLASFTDWGWYVFLLVPIFGVYLLVTKIILPLMAANKKQQEEPMDEATRKRLERTQQRADRRRVKRI
jgi:hypothetical protein